MKIIRNINNNVSICVDDAGREVIAFGKGIGFLKPPNTIPIDKIEKTFYNLNDMNSEILKDINPKVVNCSVKIIEMVEEDLNIKFMSTAFLALADHINFAIERKEKNVQFNMDFQQQILLKNPKMILELPKILEIIINETAVELDKNEAEIIACHLIDNKIDSEENELNISYEFKKECLGIINDIFQEKIDEDSYNYSRFILHLEYLISRILDQRQLKNTNDEIYYSMKVKYPLSSRCVDELNELFRKKLNVSLNDEEKLYLLIHINRGWLED